MSEHQSAARVANIAAGRGGLSGNLMIENRLSVISKEMYIVIIHPRMSYMLLMLRKHLAFTTDLYDFCRIGKTPFDATFFRGPRVTSCTC